MSSRIEQIIEDIEEYIEDCKFQPLSSTKIIVNKEEMMDLVRELKLKTPDEIKRYQKIISNKDAILQDAQNRADGIVNDAKAQADKMITEHEIMQQAYARANDTVNEANRQAQEILERATREANNYQFQAVSYTDSLMIAVQDVLKDALDHAGAKYKSYMEDLSSCLDVVKQNRQQLAPQLAQAAAMGAASRSAEQTQATPAPTPVQAPVERPQEMMADEDDFLDDLD